MTGRIVERGRGRPIVVVPGVQGRCEWGLPTVHALAGIGRAITYSLCDEPSSGFEWREAIGFENYLAQLDEVLDATGAEDPVIVGVSYGGLIAAEYVARHPGSVAGLVVASAPPPTWTLPARARRYLTAPRLMAPAFWLGAPLRVYPELKASIPDRRERWHFVVDHGWRIVAAPVSPARMARRLRWLDTAHFSFDHPIDVPAVIVTGEPDLERVVPPAATLQYRAWLPHAQVVVLARTGHNGSVTKAREFAVVVAALIAGLPVAGGRGSAPSSSEIVRAH